MLLRNDLLNPISPDKPAGENLRFAPIYDRIKDARREEDAAPQGEWKREIKAADWPLTIKLISEALATKTKDLQLSAWLAEAMLRQHGIAGFRESLDFIRAELEKFWDGLYPELEDGDAEFRSAPLRWLGEKNDRVNLAIKTCSITKGKLNYLQYREARTVGLETAADTREKKKARETALNEGKIPEEVFEKDFATTPKSFYVDLEALYDQTLESLAQLSDYCDEKFGDVSPSYNDVKDVMTEVRQVVHVLLVRKRELEPDAPPPAAAPEPVAEEAPPPPVPVAAPAPAPAAAAAAPAPAPAPPPPAPAAAKPAAPAASSSEIKTSAEALDRLIDVAQWLRRFAPYTPVPYLVVRGVRWGEVRLYGSKIKPQLLVAPPGDVRSSIKTFALDKKWPQVLDAAETAMGMECGRGWLDLQRYIAHACSQLGEKYDNIRRAVIAETRAYLGDYPSLLEMSMMDDTPTANPETVAWLNQDVLQPGAAPPVAAAPAPAPAAPQPVFAAPPPSPPNPASAEAAEPDAFDLAMQSARAGRPQEGIEILMREMMQEPSGRGRFQRRVQVAQLCLGMGKEAIALPILQEAVDEIERRQLEEWESREMVAHPLALLYRCLAKNNTPPDQRQKLYSRLCRLDPIEAMNVAK